MEEEIVISVTRTPWWSLHSHSKFSVNDALPAVELMVERAVTYGYPALGLTDHGTVSGAIALYKACRKFGIEPLPGIELYVVPDTEYAGRGDNMHLTVAAYTEAGYRNLVHLSTLAHRRFWYKPRVDFADFAAMADDGATEGLVVATGCHFGVLPQVFMRHGEKAADRVAKTLDGWFPRVYIELQNHGIEEHNVEGSVPDSVVLQAMWEVSQRTGIPPIITRDSHYTDEGDRPLHEQLKQLVSFSDDPDDAVFPGGGYHMADEAEISRWFPPVMLEAGLDSLADLAGAAYLRLPELEEFQLKVPDVAVTGDPMAVLSDLVWSMFATSEFASSKAHRAQINDELDVVAIGGMAQYMLLVYEVAKMMRESGISFHTRGSASGSMVLRVMLVTQLDPLKYGLRFDRFLSRNRLKPPDVDFDVEHLRRDEVIAWIESRWAVRSVGSIRKYSLVEDEDDADESAGSLRVRFYSTLRKRGITATKWADIPKQDRDDLQALSDLKLIAGAGTHAAGYIVAPDERSVEQLPLAYIASSHKLVTAYGKKDVELLGYTKLDLLGLRTRTAIRVSTELAGIDFEAIPLNDKTTFAMIGQGRTEGVFQLEGYTMKRGCQKLRPRRLEDLIAAQALFRPATMSSGATDDYLLRRRKQEPIPARHEDIMEATAETFGVLLYQEQVMDVMETLGMNPAELEQMLDAVKASNEYSEGAALVIADKMPRIKDLATTRGWTDIDIAWLVDGLGAYADYSFNKAHAASYGLIAYRTAWMKQHYPLEFWTGMLQAYDGASKVKGRPPKDVQYAAQVRRDGHRLLPPHVNESKETYSLDRAKNGIRRGLKSVQGVGTVAALELVTKAPFTSLRDLGERVTPRKVTGAKHLALGKSPLIAGGNVLALDEAGAFSGLS